MSTAEIEVVEGFTSIGVAPDKAMAAAAAINRRDAMADLGTVRKDIAAVQPDVNLLKWMVAFLLAIAVAILVKQFVR
jgi:hypothetical protein